MLEQTWVGKTYLCLAHGDEDLTGITVPLHQADIKHLAAVQSDFLRGSEQANTSQGAVCGI